MTNDDQAQKPFGLDIVVDPTLAPDEWRLQSKQEEPYPGMPDASPRKWKIAVAKNRNAMLDGPIEVVHVIEKSAYDALAKRVAELEAPTYISNSHMETIRENQDILNELTAAKAENERLKVQYDERGMAMRETGDMVRSLYGPKLTQANAEIERLKNAITAVRQGSSLMSNPSSIDWDLMFGDDDSQLTQANARIADLEASVEWWKRLPANGKELELAKEREQNLVAALEDCSAQFKHGYRENVDIAAEALKAHKREGEGRDE